MNVTHITKHGCVVASAHTAVDKLSHLRNGGKDISNPLRIEEHIVRDSVGKVDHHTGIVQILECLRCVICTALRG